MAKRKARKLKVGRSRKIKKAKVDPHRQLPKGTVTSAGVASVGHLGFSSAMAVNRFNEPTQPKLTDTRAFREATEEIEAITGLLVGLRNDEGRGAALLLWRALWKLRGIDKAVTQAPDDDDPEGLNE